MKQEEVFDVIKKAGEKGQVVNLQEADLSFLDLENVNLEKARLDDANLKKARLKNANLNGAVLVGANLKAASLQGSTLIKTNLRESDLDGADLEGADLSQANFTDAYLRWVNLKDTNLHLSIFVGADIRDVDFMGANLEGTNFRNANLTDAHFGGAKNIPDYVYKITSIVPDGDIIAWKKLRDGKIAKLFIPAYARRTNATGRKCRTEFADVLEIWDKNNSVSEGESLYYPNFIYRAGKRVCCDNWITDRWIECGGGIHFFLLKEEAEEFYM